MKIYSEQAIFIQTVPIPERSVVEVDDTYAARLIADNLVRAATEDEITAAGELTAAPITENTAVALRDAASEAAQ